MLLVLSMCHQINRAFPRILIDRRSTFDFPFSYRYNTLCLDTYTLLPGNLPGSGMPLPYRVDLLIVAAALPYLQSDRDVSCR